MDATIHLEVWSGALGVPILRKVLDAGQLSADKREELEQLVKDSGVLQQPMVPEAPARVRDSNQLKIDFDFAGKTQTVRIPEEVVSGHLRALIDFVRNHGS